MGLPCRAIVRREIMQASADREKLISAYTATGLSPSRTVVGCGAALALVCALSAIGAWSADHEYTTRSQRLETAKGRLAVE